MIQKHSGEMPLCECLDGWEQSVTELAHEIQRVLSGGVLDTNRLCALQINVETYRLACERLARTRRAREGLFSDISSDPWLPTASIQNI